MSLQMLLDCKSHDSLGSTVKNKEQSNNIWGIIHTHTKVDMGKDLKRGGCT